MMPEIKEKVNNYGSIKPMRRGASQYHKTRKDMNFTQYRNVKGRQTQSKINSVTRHRGGDLSISNTM